MKIDVGSFLESLGLAIFTFVAGFLVSSPFQDDPTGFVGVSLLLTVVGTFAIIVGSEYE